MSQISKMSLYKILTLSLLLAGVFLASAAIAKPGGGKGGGKGGGNAGSGNGGEDEAVYSAAGDLINEPAAGYIDSTNLSFDEIIFRPNAGFTLDLSGFDVDGPNGPCTNFSYATTGTLVLSPGDSANPGSAELRFGFQGLLSDGSKTAQHYLVMNGTMDGDWSPTGTDVNSATELVLTDWSIAAEKRNAQNKDCEGSGEDGPYLVLIWHSTP